MGDSILGRRENSDIDPLTGKPRSKMRVGAIGGRPSAAPVIQFDASAIPPTMTGPNAATVAAAAPVRSQLFEGRNRTNIPPAIGGENGALLEKGAYVGKPFASIAPPPSAIRGAPSAHAPISAPPMIPQPSGPVADALNTMAEQYRSATPDVSGAPQVAAPITSAIQPRPQPQPVAGVQPYESRGTIAIPTVSGVHKLTSRPTASFAPEEAANYNRAVMGLVPTARNYDFQDERSARLTAEGKQKRIETQADIGAPNSQQRKGASAILGQQASDKRFSEQQKLAATEAAAERQNKVDVAEATAGGKVNAITSKIDADIQQASDANASKERVAAMNQVNYMVKEAIKYGTKRITVPGMLWGTNEQDVPYNIPEDLPMLTQKIRQGLGLEAAEQPAQPAAPAGGITPEQAAAELKRRKAASAAAAAAGGGK